MKNFKVPNRQVRKQRPQLEPLKERYLQAEQLRANALNALNQVNDVLAKHDARQSDSQLAINGSQEALTNIDAMRRLFFSLLEHLQALLQDQAETHDETATLQVEAAADTIGQKLGPVSHDQTQHAGLAAALAQTLTQQADAAASSTEQSDSQSQENFAQAADEMKTATTECRLPAK